MRGVLSCCCTMPMVTLAPSLLRLPEPAPAPAASSSIISSVGSFAPFPIRLHLHRSSSNRWICRIVEIEEHSHDIDHQSSKEGAHHHPHSHKRFGRAALARSFDGQHSDTGVESQLEEPQLPQRDIVERGRRAFASPEAAGISKSTPGQPPWQQAPVVGRHRYNADSGSSQIDENATQHNFRPAPWQQVSKERPEGSKATVEEQDAGADGDTESDKSAMARIVEKLRSIQETSDPGPVLLPKGNEDLFYIGKSWSTPDHPVPEPGRGVKDTKFPWERDEAAEEEEMLEKKRRVKPPTLAERMLSPVELRRLRLLSVGLEPRAKVGKLGVTDNIVHNIKEKWRTCELVKVKCEGPAAMSIKRTLEDLEQKTGGLVISRVGSAAVIYRGRDSSEPLVHEEVVNGVDEKLEGVITAEHGESSHAKALMNEPGDTDDDGEEEDAGGQIETLVSPLSNTRPQTASDPHIDRQYEMEVESILSELGPRFEAWQGLRPLPVDADLLPATIPNYSPPFRLLPYGVKPTLTNAQLTNLRRLARPVAPHFALGRNRGLQGLAVAILKLWEKSEIAKIAVKRRVQNTNNELMAEQIKRLTGGVLLARDKFFITFYRGKDFLPQEVAAALTERETIVRALHEQEEIARADRSIAVHRDTGIRPSVVVTAKEVPLVKPSWVESMDLEDKIRLKKEAAEGRRQQLAKRIERRIDLALAKKEKAQQDLEKVEAFLKPIDRPADVETITEEERFMFRKLGLRTKAFLLLGRRGVFDGVVENMHLHWKHRELVKIIVKERDPVKLQETARMLEYESGGILVAVVTTSKGQAIIVYRGKNYKRPAQLRPRNLLTKRKALKRSLEVQRRESLSRHILDLEQEISNMKAGLSELDTDEHGELKEEFHDYCGSLSSDELEIEGLIEGQQGDTALSGEEATRTGLSNDEPTKATIARLERAKLKRLTRLGPIYRAEPLTNKERLKLRKEALNLGKAAQFHVGKSNVLTGLAKAIRMYFVEHALVKIGVKGRGRGTSLQDLVHELEDLTGGVLVSQEPSKVIFYRGWPDGEEFPTSESYEVLSPELRAALEAEEDDWEENLIDDDYTVGDVDDADTDADEEVENEEFIIGMHLDEEAEDENDIEGLDSDGDDFPDDEAEESSEDENDVLGELLDLNNVLEDEAEENGAPCQVFDEMGGRH